MFAWAAAVRHFSVSLKSNYGDFSFWTCVVLTETLCAAFAAL